MARILSFCFGSVVENVAPRFTESCFSNVHYLLFLRHISVHLLWVVFYFHLAAVIFVGCIKV
jgi:hypothetical protein